MQPNFGPSRADARQGPAASASNGGHRGASQAIWDETASVLAPDYQNALAGTAGRAPCCRRLTGGQRHGRYGRYGRYGNGQTHLLAQQQLANAPYTAPVGSQLSSGGATPTYIPFSSAPELQGDGTGPPQSLRILVADDIEDAAA